MRKPAGSYLAFLSLKRTLLNSGRRINRERCPPNTLLIYWSVVQLLEMDYGGETHWYAEYLNSLSCLVHQGAHYPKRSTELDWSSMFCLRIVYALAHLSLVSAELYVQHPSRIWTYFMPQYNEKKILTPLNPRMSCLSVV